MSSALIDPVPRARCEMLSFIVQSGSAALLLYICSKFHCMFVLRSITTPEDQLEAVEVCGYCPCKELHQSP